MANLTSSLKPESFPQALQTASSTSSSTDVQFSFQERLLSAQEVADRLGVSERWVRDHATRRNPRIRAVKLGPLLRFRWLDVQTFITELATQKPFKRR
jgi:excisionase family DNA binding protein